MHDEAVTAMGAGFRVLRVGSFSLKRVTLIQAPEGFLNQTLKVASGGFTGGWPGGLHGRALRCARPPGADCGLVSGQLTCRRHRGCYHAGRGAAQRSSNRIAVPGHEQLWRSCCRTLHRHVNTCGGELHLD